VYIGEETANFMPFARYDNKMSASCVFCKIVSGDIPACKVYEDDVSIVFLDNGPLFPGHCLIAPKLHVETLADLPPSLVQPIFANAQLIARAVERGLSADGSFVAVNNRISQSVPHLHVHVVPRRKKDGLKGFFWPRQPYRDEDEKALVLSALRSAVKDLKTEMATLYSHPD
jgi:histidine triad (HIT) family protein